jgi:hypothetical protein
MVNSCDIDAGRDHRPLTKWLLSGSCDPCRILAEKRKNCSLSLLEGVSELPRYLGGEVPFMTLAELQSGTE